MPASRSTLGNLPTPLTSFIGREQELAEVQAQIARSEKLASLSSLAAGEQCSWLAQWFLR